MQGNARLHRTRTLASNFPRPESSRLQDMGLTQDRVYQTTIHDVDELKQRLIAVWAHMKQSVINKAIDEWRSRLTACVHAKRDILNICIVDHEHYFFACLTVCLRNFNNVVSVHVACCIVQWWRKFDGRRWDASEVADYALVDGLGCNVKVVSGWLLLYCHQ